MKIKKTEQPNSFVSSNITQYALKTKNVYKKTTFIYKLCIYYKRLHIYKNYKYNFESIWGRRREEKIFLRILILYDKKKLL